MFFNRATHSQPSNAVGCVYIPSANCDTITQLEFSMQEQPFLASCGWDQTIRVWKFDDYTYQNPKYFNGVKELSNNTILRFCFDEICTKIYYGTSAGEIKEFDFLKEQNPHTTSANIKNIPLQISNYNNQLVKIPPSKYLVFGLKWHDDYKLITALTTNGYQEKSYPHSYIGFVDPSTNACTFREIQFVKIINIDISGDRVYFISISSQDVTPKIAYLDLSNINSLASPFVVIKSQIQSMPTSIAALPQGLDGYIVSTMEGFVEIIEGHKSFYERVFKKEDGPNKLTNIPANCVSVCKFDKKIAMVCGQNEFALFNLESALYKKFIPIAEKLQTTNPITACAFSPNGEFFAVAYGYDWAKGAEEMKKIKNEPVILIGPTPDQPS